MNMDKDNLTFNWLKIWSCLGGEERLVNVCGLLTRGNKYDYGWIQQKYVTYHIYRLDRGLCLIQPRRILNGCWIACQATAVEKFAR